MVTLTLNDEQVLELVTQLSDDRQAWLFQHLLRTVWPQWVQLSDYATERAKSAANARGQDWERMTESEREEFIDSILHE